MRCHLLYSTLTCSALLAWPAAAAPVDPETQRAAQALFDSATALEESGDYVAACSKFEGAAQLYPTGAGIREHLAECYFHLRKFASAEATFERARSMSAANPERAERNRQRKEDVGALVSRLTINVTGEIAAIPGLVLTRDGQSVPPEEFNSAIGVDGGTVVIHAEAPGYGPFDRLVDIPDEKGNVALTVELARAAPTAIIDQGATRRDPGPQGATMTTTRFAGFVVGGIGLAIGAVGAGVGAYELAQTNDAVDAFAAAQQRGDRAAEHQARQDYTDGSNGVIAGWTLVGIGGAALVAGVIVVALGGAEDSPTTARLLVSPRGMALSSSW